MPTSKDLPDWSGFGPAETLRLLLEPWGSDPAHTAALIELNEDPEVMRFLGGPAAPELSREVSARLARHWETFGFGLWAVIPRDSGHVVGFAGICRPLWHADYADEVEVAWRLARAAWGHGYATEAASAALSAGWAAGLEEVIAFIDHGNHRSRAVAGRLGFTPRETTADPRSGEELSVLVLRRPE
jgi:RimJ/RimL family protein N-acetyltransferase